MENETFTYKLPKLNKDKENKKWFVRYAIKYPADEAFTYYKEYGRQFFEKSLNLIQDKKKREQSFNELIELIKIDLEDGIDRKNPGTIKAAIEKELAEKNKYNFDTCVDLYLLNKGYINPIPKKEKSAQTLRMFLLNQLRPYLESRNLVNDIRKITKTVLVDYLDGNFKNNKNPKGWTEGTYNTKITFLGSFFSYMYYKDIIPENPVKKIESKKRDKSTRFGLYTMEERDIYFKHLEEHNFPLLTITKVVYFSFIRFSELVRIRIKDFDFVNKRIRIDAENSKTGQQKYVKMRKPLIEALTEYLNRNEHQPDWYMFGKGTKPSPHKFNGNWHKLYSAAIKQLRKDNPSLFKDSNLVPYAWKHTGVSHFIQNNIKAKSTTELLQYVMRMCRHSDFKTTQKYWIDLGFEIDTDDDFVEL